MKRLEEIRGVFLFCRHGSCLHESYVCDKVYILKTIVMLNLFY